MAPPKILAAVMASLNDMCHRMDPNSYCSEQNHCWGHEISCTEAYISSTQLERHSNQIPLVTKLSFGQYDKIRKRLNPNRNGSSPKIPQQIATHPIHMNFMETAQNLARILYLEFPLVSWDQTILTDLISQAQSVYYEIIRPRLSVPNPNMNIETYRNQIATSVEFDEVNSVLLMLIRYLHGLSRSSELRTSMFANLIPIVHAWDNLHQILGIESPMSGSDEFLEFLVEAQKYRPLYTTGQDSEWVLKLYLHGYPQLMLPITAPESFDDFPLGLYDHLDIPITADPIGLVIPSLVELLEDHNLDNTRAILFFVLRHPRMRKSDQEFFCQLTQPLWGDVFTALRQYSDPEGSNRTKFLDLLELVELCGDSYISIEDRVTKWLPLYFGRNRNMRKRAFHLKTRQDPNSPSSKAYTFTYLSHVSLRYPRASLRYHLNETTTDLEHEHKSVVRDLTREAVNSKLEKSLERLNIEDIIRNEGKMFFARKALMLGIGTAIGQSILLGDPGRHLYTAISTNKISSLNMSSRNVLAGICTVLDCLVLKTLFRKEEMATFLEILHNNIDSFIT